MNFALRDSLKHTPAQADDYLASLNAEQRAAVEHGDGAVAGPLLVIAGAGSGKTNTLAHRVAHLIVKGADPRRILLMTFSRRAASEMKIRVERIAARVMGDKAAALTEGLTWAGTFHAIGARLLRDYALEIGLDPAFTIHDREDSADLMNLVRHELGLSKTESRFPAKGTCLAIYSRVINAQSELEPILAKSFPWCIGWAEELKQLFAAYVDAKQAQNVLDYDDLLLWWAQMCGEPAMAEHLGGRFDHILVDEYQDTNRLQASIYTTRERFLTDLTLDPPDATSDEAGPPHLDEDYLILSTIHSAKGQEWTKVFVLNAVDGCIPIDLAVGERDEIEEERRLLYVAMTRAKDSLHLITPQRFFVHGQAARGDRHVYASRTRFIAEHMLDRFALTSWPPPSHTTNGRAPQPGIRVDLKAKMRGMWR